MTGSQMWRCYLGLSLARALGLAPFPPYYPPWQGARRGKGAQQLGMGEPYPLLS